MAAGGWLVSAVARTVIRRRKMVQAQVDVETQVTGADLSARDNAALAVAMSSAIAALVQLRDR